MFSSGGVTVPCSWAISEYRVRNRLYNTGDRRNLVNLDNAVLIDMGTGVNTSHYQFNATLVLSCSVKDPVNQMMHPLFPFVQTSVGKRLLILKCFQFVDDAIEPGNFHCVQ
jgi:hypothetical protein